MAIGEVAASAAAVAMINDAKDKKRIMNDIQIPYDAFF
jgi:hypothetical protein